MLKIHKVVLAALGCALSPTSLFAGTVAGPGGHLYEFVPSQVRWSDANAAATAMGGYLTTIGNSTEQTFVENLLKSENASNGAYWFGLHETATEGDFRYHTTVTPSYTNWLTSPVQPDNFGGNEVAGSILWDGAGNARSGHWNDLPNSLGYTQVQSVYPDLVAQGYVVEFLGDGPLFNSGDFDNLNATAAPLPPALYSLPVLGAVAWWAVRRNAALSRSA